MTWLETGRILVVGLGNPGSRYAKTRHNVGFMLAEMLAEDAGLALNREKFRGQVASGSLWARDFTVLLPQTFMNLSGDSVAEALIFLGLAPTQAVLLHDDLDLPLGTVKVKVGGGHGGHNGLRSIFAETESRDYVRVRLGIGRPASGSTTDHVLGPFSEDEAEALDEALDLGMSALRWIFEKGPQAAMNAINGVARQVAKAETESEPSNAL